MAGLISRPFNNSLFAEEKDPKPLSTRKRKTQKIEQTVGHWDEYIAPHINGEYPSHPAKVFVRDKVDQGRSNRYQ